MTEPEQKTFLKTSREVWNKLISSKIFNQVVELLPNEKNSRKLIVLGILAFLLGKIVALQEQLVTVSEHLNTIAKHEGIKLYDRKKMKKVTLGDIYLEIPQEWDNFIENYQDSPRGDKHFIASAGDGFALPYSSEYAFMVGIEQRNVFKTLENFLQTHTLSSEQRNADKNFTKVNEDMFYIRREGIGVEYLKKVDNTVIVIFVYDNGDRVTDDLEQKIINSVGVIERDTLFDYK